MKTDRRLAERATRALLSTRDRFARRGGERGDVPGWVLITIMTAGLVAMLWTAADGVLKDMFEKAVKGVDGP